MSGEITEMIFPIIQSFLQCFDKQCLLGYPTQKNCALILTSFVLEYMDK